MTLMLIVASFSLMMLIGIAIMNPRLRRARGETGRYLRERYGYQPSTLGSSDSVSGTGGWGLSNWFGDFGSSGHDGCVSSDSGGGDCGGGGDGGGGGH
jgi:hypothetical protein